MKYTKDRLQEAARESTSIRGVCVYLGIEKPGGGIQNHLSRQLKRWEIDTSHFLGQGWNRGGKAINRRTAQEILARKPKGSSRERGTTLRRALIETGRTYECAGCKNGGEWLGCSITLEVHHKDGNWQNNEATNLDFMCPNCHSMM